VSGQIERRRNKLKLELQRRSGYPLNRYSAVAVKPGFLSNWRKANLRPFINL